jgi:hypothetical protein
MSELDAVQSPWMVISSNWVSELRNKRRTWMRSCIGSSPICASSISVGAGMSRAHCRVHTGCPGGSAGNWSRRGNACASPPAGKDSEESPVSAPKHEVAGTPLPRTPLSPPTASRQHQSAWNRAVRTIPRKCRDVIEPTSGMAGACCINEPMSLGERSAAPMRWSRSHRPLSGRGSPR